MLGPANRKIIRIRGVRTPDIVVVDEEGKVWFVIEQDGRIHDSKKVAGKDEERNRHYADAGIPCIVLNTRDIRSEGVSPAEYLDQKMAEILGATEPASSPPAPDGGDTG